MKNTKGRKFYAIHNKGTDYINYVSENSDYAQKNLKDGQYLVEITITRVFMRNPEITEIEQGIEI